MSFPAWTVSVQAITAKAINDSQPPQDSRNGNSGFPVAIADPARLGYTPGMPFPVL